MERKGFDILFVDDNEEDAAMAIRALRKFNLAEALLHLENGAEALQYLHDNKDRPDRLPKIILLDLNMPKVGGVEVLREIRTNDKLKHLHVVIMTASKEDNDIIETYQLGVSAYIVKPVDVEKFVKTVNDLGMHWMVMNSASKKKEKIDS